MSKLIYQGQEAREGLFQGAIKIANIIGDTLGPFGSNIIYEGSSGTLNCSRDGVSIIHEVILKDPLENAGARFLKEAALKTNEFAGDGTTTATVLAGAFLQEALKQFDLNPTLTPYQLKKEFDDAIKIAYQFIKNNVVKMTTLEQVKQCATIAAANDEGIGEMLETAVKVVGFGGPIVIKDSNDSEIKLEIQNGLRVDSGFISSKLTTGVDPLISELDNPYIFYFEGVLETEAQILPILQQVAKTKTRSILFMAEDIRGSALLSMEHNHQAGTVKICAVKPPFHRAYYLDGMLDLTYLTGGKVFRKVENFDWDAIQLSDLGRADFVKSHPQHTEIIVESPDVERLKERVEFLKNLLENEPAQHRKDKIKQRLGKLTSGVAIIHVGAPTHREQQDKRLRIEDAILAVNSAMTYGVTPGGGTIQRLAAHKVIATQAAPNAGNTIVSNGLLSLTKRIIENAGLTYSTFIGAESFVHSTEPTGYNPLNGRVGNMFEMGIIDSAAVSLFSLLNAASVAGELIITKGAILELSDEKMSHIDNTYS